MFLNYKGDEEIRVELPEESEVFFWLEKLHSDSLAIDSDSVVIVHGSISDADEFTKDISDLFKGVTVEENVCATVIPIKENPCLFSVTSN